MHAQTTCFASETAGRQAGFRVCTKHATPPAAANQRNVLILECFVGLGLPSRGGGGGPTTGQEEEGADLEAHVGPRTSDFIVALQGEARLAASQGGGTAIGRGGL